MMTLIFKVFGTIMITISLWVMIQVIYNAWLGDTDLTSAIFATLGIVAGNFVYHLDKLIYYPKQSSPHFSKSKGAKTRVLGEPK